MRRREDVSAPPARLVTFDPGDWPDAADDQAAYRVWREARRAWAAERGGWPGVEDVDGLDAVIQAPDEPWDPDAV